MGSASQAPQDAEFQIFVKPVGGLCNIRCQYCYYLDPSANAARVPFSRMPDDLLELYIRSHIQGTGANPILFSWHGGEPTLAGLAFYRRVIELQKKHCPPGRVIINGMQTNGLAVDERWARFFASEGFQVGLSMDGPAELHDAFRRTLNHKPTHHLVMRAFELLESYRVPLDILCVVHSLNVVRPLDVYRFFRDIGATSITFLPLVEQQPEAAGQTTSRTVPAEAFGDFLCRIFDEWWRRDRQRIYVQNFDEALRPLLGRPHSLCVFRPTCGQIPVLEHDGSVYCCDHFVGEEWFLGNLQAIPLARLLTHPRLRAFGAAKDETLPEACRECDVLDMCNGGCPKDRILVQTQNQPPLNYLCAGYKKFFLHVRSVVHATVHVPINRPTAPAPSAFAGSGLTAGRNDPCPCGSGLKFKKCCGGRA